MKTRLAWMGKSLGFVVILFAFTTFGLYIYLCRSVDVPASKNNTPASGSYPIVDTAQNTYWDSKGLDSWT